MEVVAIKGNVRASVGKKAVKSVRKNQEIPAVMYGKEEVHHFSIGNKEAKPLVYTPAFKLAEIDLEGSNHRAILKEIQFHPVTEQILHMDFLKLYDGVPVNVEVPIRFNGTSLGEKAGGKLIQAVRKVKIKTIPEKLIDEVAVDITNVELGQAIRVRDIDSTDGVEIMNPPNAPLATVEIPRALKSAAAAEEGATAAAEGEETTDTPSEGGEDQ